MPLFNKLNCTLSSLLFLSSWKTTVHLRNPVAVFCHATLWALRDASGELRDFVIYPSLLWLAIQALFCRIHTKTDCKPWGWFLLPKQCSKPYVDGPGKKYERKVQSCGWHGKVTFYLHWNIGKLVCEWGNHVLRVISIWVSENQNQRQAITMANHKKRKQQNKPIKTRSKY